MGGWGKGGGLYDLAAKFNLQIEFSCEILIHPCHWSAVTFSIKLSGRWLERLVPSVLLTNSAGVLQE